MDITFKYAIGDAVVSQQVMLAVRLEMTAPKQFSRTNPSRILERMSLECIGGTQLFYICESWEGVRGTFAEGILVPYQDYFEQWVKWFEAKESKP
jgi:hypothetical protein